MLGRPMRVRRPLASIALLASLALAGAARAQHGMAVGPRPLHLRLAEADVVAIASVADVREDRVVLKDAVVLRGEAAASFELKRAPSREVPYAVGLTLLLPLRGARPPYVLEDDAHELVVLRDAAGAAAWRDAVSALLEAGSDPESLLAVYLGWLDGPEESLREIAGAALLDPRSALTPVSPARAVERAGAALDPSAAMPARRVSAILAAAQQEGASVLLAALRDPATDPQLAEIALRSAVQFRLDGLDDALLAGLAHPDPEVRRVAVTLVASTRSAPGLARLPALASQDPDAEVRREASDVVGAASE
jgi:hypothetical protein